MELIGQAFLSALDVAVQLAAGKLDRGLSATPPPMGSHNR